MIPIASGCEPVLFGAKSSPIKEKRQYRGAVLSNEMVSELDVVEFGISNYRSFGEVGFRLIPSKRLNFIIGRNNSGKSNVLEAITLLSEITDNSRNVKRYSFADRPYNAAAGSAPLVYVGLSTKEICRLAQTRDAHVAAALAKKMGAVIGLRWNGLMTNELAGSNLPPLSRPEAWLLCNTLSNDRVRNDAATDAYVNHSIDLLSQIAARSLNTYLGRELLFIPIKRSVGKEPGNNGPRFDGRAVIRKLKEMKDPEHGEDAAANRIAFEKVTRFVRALLGEEQLALSVTAREDTLMVEIRGRIFPLSSYGTGLEHVVVLASALAMFNGKTVLIEEPETNLHPELQRQLARFIEKETSHRCFISTHSNIFLDLLPEHSAVFHVRHDGANSTLQRAETTSQSRDILTDMGYKASDLLQANAIIWVEGPSDRIYLTKWIGLIAPELIEGIHFAITFYGGRILSHFTASHDPIGDLVQVLRINRNAMMMVDRDGDSDAELLNSTKTRILDELGPEACWVTEGREVENYVREERIRNCLKDKYPEAVDLEVGKDDRLSTKFTDLASAPKEYDKVKYARLFCETMTVADLDQLDLRVRIHNMVSQIRMWNQAQLPRA